MGRDAHRYETIETLVFDESNQVQLAFLPGAVCLPVGSVVELSEPNRDALITGVRLLLAGDSALVLLLVDDPRGRGSVIPRSAGERILEESSLDD